VAVLRKEEPTLCSGGFQIYFPTEAERKSGAKHTFEWTFPSGGLGEKYSMRADTYGLE
jgi:hypothetical protein